MEEDRYHFQYIFRECEISLCISPHRLYTSVASPISYKLFTLSLHQFQKCLSCLCITLLPCIEYVIILPRVFIKLPSMCCYIHFMVCCWESRQLCKWNDGQVFTEFLMLIKAFLPLFNSAETTRLSSQKMLKKVWKPRDECPGCRKMGC